MMAWRSCCSPFGPFIDSPIGPSCGPCFRFASMFIVYPCRGKQDGGVVSRLTACPGPAPLNPPPRCPLPHSLFAPPSHPSSRHAVSPLVSFSCRPASSSRSHFIPSCPMCRTAFRPSCGRAVLFSSSHRSPHALPSSSPHGRITRAGQRIPPTPSERASNKPTEPYGTRRTPIVMIRIARRPRRNALSHIHNTTETKDE